MRGLTLESTVLLANGVLNGVAMPRLGFGVYQIPAGVETRRAVHWALEAGYRLLDTASIYGNETDVGRAVHESGIAREDVFITTKLWNEDQGYDTAVAALDASLRRLGLAYVDLYLIHWPTPGLRLESWRALERSLEDGKARANGVSNYMTHHLEELLAAGATVPAVNQIEVTPYNYWTRAEVVDLCREHGIRIEAYSPLTKGLRLGDPRLGRIAERYGKTPAQVLIRWALQHDFIVIPKSSHRERIRENAAVFDFHISDDDMAELDAFDEGLTTGWDPSEIP